jgi:hypothetical protein
MDTEDRDHFKTMHNPSPRHLEIWRRRQKEASSLSSPDQAYCQKAAQAICSCYRRDEAHDAQGYAAGLGAVLSDYSRQVVDFVADPRTGVTTEFPMGLPNVGQIRDFCDVIVRRMDVLSKPKPIAAPYVPPPLRPGEITYGEFLARVATGELKPRPIGRFEQEPL